MDNVNLAAVQDNEVDLFALVRTVWNRRWLVVGLTAIGAVIGLVYALSAAAVYRAEVVVTDARESNLGGGSSLAKQMGGIASLAGLQLGAGSDAAREAHAVLSSRRLVEEFLKRNDLFKQLNEQRGSDMTAWHAVEYFRKNVMSVREDQRQGLTFITVEWGDPATAAQWANAIVALSNEVIRVRAIEDSNRNIAYLKAQIAKTDVVELQRVMYNLIESETKTNMLANARPDYAFTVIDPAVAPELRVWPRRSIIVILGVLLGFSVAVITALILGAVGARRVRT
jgi:uncharacterized protein involved in exopolysaccharide biosynthesis